MELGKRDFPGEIAIFGEQNAVEKRELSVAH
jgi:hypothetical protein